MMNNDLDGEVFFSQGEALFTTLRREGKKVWMLEYKGEGHMVFGDDALDYTVRMKQFFDYYLKGGPNPDWMTSGPF